MKNWWKESVVYQIYPRSFMDKNGDGVGDLQGIITKLDYLKTLGIDVIWLSPIYSSPNDDNGYDISNYQEIMREFGTLQDFDELLVQAHSRGLKLVLDLVVNHTSDEHSWFIESRKSRENSYRDYYIWKDGADGGKDRPPNNWGSVFSGSAWKYDEATGQYYLHLFSPKQPDLNWENRTVRDEIYRMMTWWLDKGIDGFRMDVINMISKDQSFANGETNGALYGDASPYTVNGPRVHEYLKEMNTRVLSKYDIMTVGETPSVSVEDARLYTGENEHELNMVFQFEHMGLEAAGGSKWTDRRFRLTDLKRVLTKWQKGLEGCGWNSLYWNNHDQPRVVSRFGNDSEYWAQSAKMLATCLHMQQGTPYIYQGEELGMTNTVFCSVDDCRDIEAINAYHEMTTQQGVSPEAMLRYINRISRDNARTPMQWDDSAFAGFSTAEPWLAVNKNYTQINAAAQVGVPDSIFSYYQKLIELRHQYPIIVYGAYDLLLPQSEELFVYTRTRGEQQLLVICSFAAYEVNYPLPERFTTNEKQLLIANYPCKSSTEQVSLHPYEARVYLHK
ncbi:alpha-glucosidase [Hydrogenoanaerobacterium sp.]|uniref:alpha-glucosidase n=1 Tax=Hydrogenoanaerobacterium sp. TaxID=2953763 RepID=UPI0028A27EE1|nr:alpha-glucosidase [Hydrogenoanaerobacterium sp.]